MPPACFFATNTSPVKGTSECAPVVRTKGRARSGEVEMLFEDEVNLHLLPAPASSRAKRVTRPESRGLRVRKMARSGNSYPERGMYDGLS